MKTRAVLASLFVMLMWSSSAFGGLLTPFNSDSCAWEATHIVVVTKGEKIDGVVTVLESWKGDLKKGEVLKISELAMFAPAKRRTVSDGPFGKTTDPPIIVSGSRIVLFLAKEVGKEETGKVLWKPVDRWGNFETSAAWIEDKKVFAFAQAFNPGPRVLRDWKTSEKELHDKVDLAIVTKDELAKLLSKPDPAKLADSTPPFLLRTKSWYCRLEILEELGKIGPASLPAFRRILKDDALAEVHNDAVWAIRNVGGDAAGLALTEVLKQEMDYWKRVGPKLEKGWWNETGKKAGELKSVRERYGRTYSALQALNKVRSPVCQETVTTFRDYWLSLPQLSGELSQLSEECDSILKALRKP